jgi:hypothetical protein
MVDKNIFSDFSEFFGQISVRDSIPKISSKFAHVIFRSKSGKNAFLIPISIEKMKKLDTEIKTKN